jgi:lipopolysaccharide/colanic/teichoic acid biosynthesis glycosyltransferase
MSVPKNAKPAVLMLMDAAAAAIALTLLAPVLLVLALLLVLADGRPIFFHQKRIGKDGQPFVILKFRTMRSSVSGPAITAASDCRITPLGKWLRRFKLDELPQLFNVLRGEMSLIGPRPEVPAYVDASDPLWRAVLRARPGITDLATLAFRNEEELLGPAADPEAHYRAVILPAKLRLNVLYQQSRTWSRDLKLLWLTARYSFFPRGFDRERILRSLGA